MDRLKFSILAVTMLLAMIAFGLIIPLLPIYARDFGASSVEVGLLFSVTAIANLLLLPIIGPLSDRFGRVLFLCLGLGCMTLASLGFYAATSVEHLLVWRIVQGIAMSMHLPVAQAMLGDMIPPGQEGRWMGYFSAITFAGLGGGPMMGGLLNDWLGLGSVFIVSAACMFLALVVTALRLRDHVVRKAKASLLSQWNRDLLRNRILVSIFLLQVFNGAVVGLGMGFLPVLATEELGLSATAIGLVLFIRSPISALQSWSGRLADTHNRKVQIGVGVAMAAFAICSMPAAIGFWTLLLANALLSLGAVLSQPASSAYMVEEGRTIGMGFTMSLGFMAMQFGGGFGPIAAGWIMGHAGLAAGFVIAGIFNLVGLLLFLWLMREHRSGSLRASGAAH